jgi:hypothetical protein
VTYLIYRNGQQYGPYTLDDVRQYCAQGRIAQSDFAWAEGMPNWTTIETLLRMPSPSGTSSATPQSAGPGGNGAAAFCRVCASLTDESATFCGSCGAPLQPRERQSGHERLAAPDPQAPVPEQPDPSRRPRTLIGVSIGVCVVAVIVLIFLFMGSGPKPDDSLDAARQAYLQHDQANFDKYVDVSSVLGDWVDQGLSNFLQEEHAGVAQTFALESAMQAAKSAYLPAVSQSVDEFVISGTVPAESQAGGSDIGSRLLAGFLSSALRKLASTQLSYEGVSSETTSGTNAFLNVKVGTPIKSDPLIVKIKMQKEGDHWRVVAVQDIEDLLRQLGPLSTH